MRVYTCRRVYAYVLSECMREGYMCGKTSWLLCVCYVSVQVYLNMYVYAHVYVCTCTCV